MTWANQRGRPNGTPSGTHIGTATHGENGIDARGCVRIELDVVDGDCESAVRADDGGSLTGVEFGLGVSAVSHTGEHGGSEHP